MGEGRDLERRRKPVPWNIHKKERKGGGFEFTGVYLRRGSVMVRSVWIKATPRHSLLKLAVLPPLLGIALALTLLLLSLGLILAAVALLLAVCGPRLKRPEEIDRDSE